MLRRILVSTSISQLNQLQSVRHVRRLVADPGIRKRLQLFSDDFVENDPDVLESESDFLNVHRAHEQFEQEEKNFKQQVSSLIVRRKYFKDKAINFLTWSEKEQIRALNKKDPQIWTPEKLSESFPVDPFAVKLIIRNYWHPKDDKSIQRHDESVKRNWKMFKDGEIKVESMLESHLKKFANRTFEETREIKENRKYGPKIPKPSTSEFSSIITSCKKYAEAEETDQLQIEAVNSEFRFPEHRSHDPEKDSVLLEGKGKSMKLMKLDEYQKISPDIVIQNLEPPKPLSTVDDSRNALRVFKEPSMVSLSMTDEKVLKSLEIKERIRIPKKLWKEGKTYKVEDCFYDDDGEFLYRVPGLK